MRRSTPALVAIVVVGWLAPDRRAIASPHAPEGLTLSVTGHGSDVVVVHGALGDYRQWKPVAGILGHRHRVFAVSRRFHWPSQAAARDTEYTFEAQAHDLEALLATFDAPVHLVGHSYGAGVALLAALEHPERVRSLTLIEPPFASVMTAPPPEFAGERTSRDSMLQVVRTVAHSGSAERTAEAVIDWMQGGPGGFGRLPAHVRRELVANAATAVPMFAARPPRVTCEALRALNVPVLVVHGANTRLWFRAIAEATAGCVPGAETAVVPSARHMLIVENAAATAAPVEAFIDAHP